MREKDVEKTLLGGASSRAQWKRHPWEEARVPSPAPIHASVGTQMTHPMLSDAPAIEGAYCHLFKGCCHTSVKCLA